MKNTYFAGSHGLDNGMFEPIWVFAVCIYMYLFSALFVGLYFVWRGLLKVQIASAGDSHVMTDTSVFNCYGDT